MGSGRERGKTREGGRDRQRIWIQEYNLRVRKRNEQLKVESKDWRERYKIEKGTK